MKVGDLVPGLLPAWTPVSRNQELLAFDRRWRAMVSTTPLRSLATIWETSGEGADETQRRIWTEFRATAAEAKEAAEEHLIQLWLGDPPKWQGGPDEYALTAGPVRLLISREDSGDRGWLVEVIDTSSGGTTRATVARTRRGAQWLALDMAAAVFLRWAVHLERMAEEARPRTREAA